MSAWNKLAIVSDLYGSFGFSAEFCEFALDNFAPDISKSILHIGVGNGVEARVFADRGYCVTGIDNAIDMAAQANSLGITTLVHDAENLPMPDQSFQGTVLVATGVLDCIDDNQARRILKELTRISESKARLFIIHFNHYPKQELYSDLGFLDNGRLSSAARYAFWRRKISGYPVDERGVRLTRIFDLLQSRLENSNEIIDEYIPFLPEYHYIRSIEKIEGWLNEFGWLNKVISGEYSPGNIFYIIHEKI